MAVNLLDRELIPITREHTESVCTADYIKRDKMNKALVYQNITPPHVNKNGVGFVVS